MTKNRVFFKVFFIASVIGLATGLIFFNVKKAKADESGERYVMDMDSYVIGEGYGLLYGDRENDDYYLENWMYDDSVEYDFSINNECYKVYSISNFPRNTLDNSYTLFYSTPVFDDGFSNIEDENQNQYSINYLNGAMCYITIFSSEYQYSNDVFNDARTYISNNNINYYVVEGGDFEGQTLQFYYTSQNNVSSMFDLTRGNNIYLIIKADVGYFTMLNAIYYGVYSYDFVYNYPSIYFSGIKPTIVVEGRTEEEYRQYGSYMYEQGYNYGNQRGYDIGYNDGQQDGYEYGYEQGYDIGYDTGYDTGIIGGDPAIYEQGYNAGVASNSTKMGTTIAAFFQAIGNVLSIKIFGDTITLGTLIFVPVVLGLLWAILKIIRG